MSGEGIFPSTEHTFLTLRRFELSFNYGDLQLLPEVDHLPQLEVPYPITNGGQHFRRASGSCPIHSVTYIKG